MGKKNKNSKQVICFLRGHKPKNEFIPSLPMNQYLIYAWVLSGHVKRGKFCSYCGIKTNEATPSWLVLSRRIYALISPWFYFHGLRVKSLATSIYKYMDE